MESEGAGGCAGAGAGVLGGAEGVLGAEVVGYVQDAALVEVGCVIGD